MKEKKRAEKNRESPPISFRFVPSNRTSLPSIHPLFENSALLLSQVGWVGLGWVAYSSNQIKGVPQAFLPHSCIHSHIDILLHRKPGGRAYSK